MIFFILFGLFIPIEINFQCNKFKKGLIEVGTETEPTEKTKNVFKLHDIFYLSRNFKKSAPVIFPTVKQYTVPVMFN
jgi:hypothetical protein